MDTSDFLQPHSKPDSFKPSGRSAQQHWNAHLQKANPAGAPQTSLDLLIRHRLVDGMSILPRSMKRWQLSIIPVRLRLNLSSSRAASKRFCGVDGDPNLVSSDEASAAPPI